tara:strand:- start:301 stop:630 length:330 start_codon:yes stop_codon:yes gene_type:complete
MAVPTPLLEQLSRLGVLQAPIRTEVLVHVRTAQRVSGLTPELGHAQVAVLAILLTMLVTVLEAAHKSLVFAMQVMGAVRVMILAQHVPQASTRLLLTIMRVPIVFQAGT